MPDKKRALSGHPRTCPDLLIKLPGSWTYGAGSLGIGAPYWDARFGAAIDD